MQDLKQDIEFFFFLSRGPVVRSDLKTNSFCVINVAFVVSQAWRVKQRKLLICTWITEGNGPNAKKQQQQQHNNNKKKVNKTNMEAWVAAKLLTGTSHGWRVFVCSEVIIFTPAVHWTIFVSRTVRWTLSTLHITVWSLVETWSTSYKQNDSFKILW